MELSYMELREQICDVCHKMWQKGWVAANDGNVSVKLEDGTFLATPTGMSKSFITPESWCTLTETEIFWKQRKGTALLRRSRCTCAAIRNGRMWGLSSMRIRRWPQDLQWQISLWMSIP
mgnify:CR=1 FL=1